MRVGSDTKNKDLFLLIQDS